MNENTTNVLLTIQSAWLPTQRLWVGEDGRVDYSYNREEPIRVEPEVAVSMYCEDVPEYANVCGASVARRVDGVEYEGRSYRWYTLRTIPLNMAR